MECFKKLVTDIVVWYLISLMSNQTRGRFYFKRTSNGNLLGEFSNGQNDVIYTESADLIGPSKNFCGKYVSTWHDGGPVVAKLTISLCKRNPKLYEVVWDVTGEKGFEGEGMLCDDVLIGDYQGR